MNWIIGMQRAINYIEEHLTEDVDFESVAKASFSSTYHFQRVFSLLCGYTLGEYIRLRRLSLAGTELAGGKARVIDVALKYGYDSPDSFAKAFQKFHGITPSEARIDGKVLKSFSRLSIKISLEGGSAMNYRIEEKEAFEIIERAEIHSTENGENLNTIPDFWARAGADGTIERLSKLTNDDKYIFGICYGTESQTEKSFKYSIAVKCDKDTEVPEGFTRGAIGAKTWLVFDCVGAMPNAIQELWKRIVTEFFPTSVYEPTYEMDIEAYTDGDMDSPEYRSEIWIPVKKK